ncbi:hypothetical protein KUTeg_002393 [Tegillarca granosa]|uniref:Uncharacterized protein n=1 Tax=Tegillarca granosa TaxID=220873 RepID=A0ABQ9FVM5_TEGGR|nr:hypothetical protein KUTeg_002393 [Tegillarca granosa]
MFVFENCYPLTFLTVKRKIDLRDGVFGIRPVRFKGGFMLCVLDQSLTEMFWKGKNCKDVFPFIYFLFRPYPVYNVNVRTSKRNEIAENSTCEQDITGSRLPMSYYKKFYGLNGYKITSNDKTKLNGALRMNFDGENVNIDNLKIDARYKGPLLTKTCYCES